MENTEQEVIISLDVPGRRYLLARFTPNTPDRLTLEQGTWSAAAGRPSRKRGSIVRIILLDGDITTLRDFLVRHV